ncbi:glycosyltransferase family 4 protein [Vibrio vulnificus]|nr:glycosyltransferase family 4 protein [Vibrio vulnificus]
MFESPIIQTQSSPSLETKKGKQFRQRKEVWLLLDSLVYGGIESHVEQLARALKSQHIAVRVLLTNKYKRRPDIMNNLRQAGVQINYVSQLSGNHPMPVMQLAVALKRHKPLVLHTHGYKANIYARLARMMSFPNLRLVSTYHAGEQKTGKLWLYDLLDRYSSFISDHRFAVSQAILSTLPFTAEQTNNFVSVNESASKTQEKIGFVGRLSYEKAPDRFVELAEHFPSQHFHLFGDGPEREALETLANDNVHFHGFASDMATVWSTLSVLVISSRFEGLPMAALEAMANGVAVIAMQVGDLGRLIEDGKNGFLANNEPQLAQALNRWLGMNPKQRRVLLDNARNTIALNYSPQAVLPQLLSAYHIDRKILNLGINLTPHH